MSLLDVQNFLARLYTDENLRREFLSTPERIRRENNLTEQEIAELIAIFPEELNLFADSLFYKRLREVEKLLPLTRKILEKDFERSFRGFASQFTPASIKKHLEDAIAFADFLQTEEVEPFWARDAAKFERAKLEFNNFGKRFIFGVFDCDVREFVRLNANAPNEIRKKKTLAIWIKFGNKSRHFVW
jgi:hypothetical protein